MTTRWTLATVGRAAVIGALALGTGALLGKRVPSETGRGSPGPGGATRATPGLPGRDRPSPPEPAASAGAPPVEARGLSAAELAVVAPLAPGSPLDGWHLLSMQMTDAGYLSLVLTEDVETKPQLEIRISRIAPNAPAPPQGAGPYAIYYAGSRYDAAVGRALAAVAAVVEKNGAPPPPGMTAYAGR